jgi:hypothetical protein
MPDVWWQENWVYSVAVNYRARRTPLRSELRQRLIDRRIEDLSTAPSNDHTACAVTSNISLQGFL